MSFSWSLFYIFLIIVFYGGLVTSNFVPYPGEKHAFNAEDFEAKERLSSLLNREGIFLRAIENVHSQTNFLKASDFSVSGRCMNDTLRLFKSFQKQEAWAIRMVDATAKVPSGVLDGELNWYGDFDECIRIKSHELAYLDVHAPYNAKYCFANIPLQDIFRPEFKEVMPRGLNTAICVPETCTEMELKMLMNFFIDQQLADKGNISIHVDDVWCKKPSQPLDTKAIVAIVFCSLYGCILFIATTYDVVKTYISSTKDPTYTNIEESENVKETDCSNGVISEKLPLIPNGKVRPKREGNFGKRLLYFSLYTNARKLLDVSKANSTPFSSLHGMRFLSMSWVILGHTYLYGTIIFANPFSFIPKVVDRLASQVLYNGTMSVDTFFVMSSALVSYSFVKSWRERNGKINWVKFFGHRFWRLSPTYFTVLFVLITLSRYFYNGPLWPEEGLEHDECKETWWYNLLYVNNFLSNHTDLCMDWSWYLANEMQFFLVSPLFMIPFMYSECAAIVLIIGAILASSVASAAISYAYELQPHTIATDDQSEITMMVYYIKPYCRIGPYLLGIMTGYFIYKTNARVKINKILNLFIWLVAGVLGSYVIYGLYEKARVFQPLPQAQASFYFGTSKTLWSLCVSWVLFACATGNGGFINTLLSWKPFAVLGRLTFCVYLTHPLMIRTFYFSLREPLYYTDLSAIYLFLGNLMATHMLGFLVSIAVEAPMINVEKIVFPN